MTIHLTWWAPALLLAIVGALLGLRFPKREGGFMDLSPLFGCGIFLVVLVVALSLALVMKP